MKLAALNRLWPRRLHTADWVVLGAGLLLYVTTIRPFYGLTADDAYISFRYALNWASGCGPVYNCGQQPVEGYTNFGWVAIAALLQRVGVDPVTGMRFVGLLAGYLALVILTLIQRRLTKNHIVTIIPVLSLASSPFYGLNAVAGLETTAATLTVLWAAMLSMNLPDSGKRAWTAGLAWAVSFLFRPEAAGMAVLTGLWFVGVGVVKRVGIGPLLNTALRFAVGFCVLGLPYFVWRAIYYWSLLPNTYYSKRLPLSEVVPRNLKLLGTHPIFFLTTGVGALLVIGLWRRREHVYLLLLALASIAISLSVHNNFWMPGHRLYLTATALLVAILGHLSSLGADSALRWRRLAGPAATVVVLSLFAWVTWNAGPQTAREAEFHYARDDAPVKQMGLHVRNDGQPSDWLLIRDAGMVPYFAGSKINVLDMHDHSLNDRNIARKGWDLRYVLSHNPRFIVFASYFPGRLHLVHPVEGQILHSRKFRGRYRFVMSRAWSPQRHFHLYQRQR